VCHGKVCVYVCVYSKKGTRIACLPASTASVSMMSLASHLNEPYTVRRHEKVEEPLRECVELNAGRRGDVGTVADQLPCKRRRKGGERVRQYVRRREAGH